MSKIGWLVNDCLASFPGVITRFIPLNHTLPARQPLRFLGNTAYIRSKRAVPKCLSGAQAAARCNARKAVAWSARIIFLGKTSFKKNKSA